MTKIIPFYKYIKVAFKRHNIVKVSPLQVYVCILHFTFQNMFAHLPTVFNPHNEPWCRKALLFLFWK